MTINEDTKIGNTEYTIKKLVNENSQLKTELIQAQEKIQEFEDFKSNLMEKPDLLWENPNPDTTFGKQSVDLLKDISEYSTIEIYFKNWVGGHYGWQSTKCPVNEGACFSLSFTIDLYNGTAASTCHIGNRLGWIRLSKNQIEFNFQVGQIIGGNNTITNNWGVPQKILGYKGY